MIKIEDLTSGKLDGKEVFVCDYRFTDYDKKPARCITPTKCKVESSISGMSEYHLSDSVLMKLNSKGQKSGKMINIFDNTARKLFAGIPLNVFETKQECCEFFRRQIFNAISGLNNHKELKEKEINSTIEKLKSLV